MITRSGSNARAAFSANSPSAQGSTENPDAVKTSQNNFRFKSLSSTTSILFATAAAKFAPSIWKSPPFCPFVHYGTNRKLTITKDSKHIDHVASDPESLALSALGWILAEPSRAERLLTLTGLTPDVLRDNLTDRPVMAAVLEFLANHEPDLVLAADALNVSPAALIAAHETLAAH